MTQEFLEDPVAGSQSYLSLLNASQLEYAEGLTDADEDPRGLLKRVRRCRMMGSDFEEELDCALQALELYEAQKDIKGQVMALCAVADAHMAVGSLAEALSAGTDALRLSREAVDRMGEASSLMMLSKVHLLHIRFDNVVVLVREFVPLLRDLGATWGESAVLLAIADWRVASARKGPSQACREASERLKVARAQAHRWQVVIELLVMILAELQLSNTKETRRALEVIRESLLLFRASGVVWTEDVIELVLLQPPLAPRTGVEAAELRARLATATEKRDRLKESVAHLLVAQCLISSAQDNAIAFEEALEEARKAASIFSSLGSRECEAAALSVQADALLALRRIDEMATTATQALRIFKDLVHRKGEAAMLRKVATAALAKKELRPAKGMARTALALVRQMGDRPSEAALLLELVSSLIQEGEFSEALRIGEEAGRLFCEIDDRRGSTAVLNTLAPVYLHQDKPDAARKSARDVLADLKELGDRPGQVAALKTLAKAQLRCSDAKAALKSAEAAIDLDQELFPGSTECEEELLQTIVQAHVECGDHASALRLGDKAKLQMSSSTSTPLEEAQLLTTMARAHLVERDLEAATSCAKQAHEIYSKLNNVGAEKVVLEVLLEAQLQRQDFTEAMLVAKQVVSLFRGIDDNIEAERAAALVAKVHLAKGEPVRGVRIAKEAQQKLRELEDVEGDALMLEVIVDGYLARSDTTAEALKVAAEGIAFLSRVGDKNAKARAHLALARAQRAMDDVREALSSVAEACKLFRQGGNRKQELTALHAVVDSNWATAPGGRPEVLQDAVALCRECEDSALEVKLLDGLLSHLLRQQQVEEAIALANKACKSFTQRREREQAVLPLLRLAQAHAALEDHKAAIQRAQETLALLAEVTEDVDKQQVKHDATAILVASLAASGEQPLALQSAQQALAECQQIGEARMLLAQAKAHAVGNGKESLANALKVCKAAQALAHEQGDLQTEAEASRSTAEILLRQDDVKEAKKAGKETLALHVRAADKDGQARTHCLLATVFMKEKSLGETQSSALEALRLWKELGRNLEEAKAVQLLVDARLQADQAPDALRAAKEAQARFRDLNYSKGEAMSWELAAQSHMAMEAPKSAQLALKNAMELHKKAKDRPSEAKTLNLASSALVMSEDVDDALRAAREAKSIYVELGDKHGEAASLEALCSAHAAHGDGEAAVKAGKEAAAKYAMIACTKNQATANQSVASLYLQMGDTTQAAWIAHEAAALFRTASEKNGEAWALHTAAEAHLAKLQESLDAGDINPAQRMGPVEAVYDAIQALKQAKPLFKQTHDLRGEQACLYAWSRACLLRGDPREGARQAEEMQRIAERSGEKQNQAVARLLAANCYIQTENFSSAARKAEEAQVIFEETGDQEGLSNAMGVLEQVAEFRSTRVETRKDGRNLFQRKAFPWNHAQAEAQEFKGIGGP